MILYQKVNWQIVQEPVGEFKNVLHTLQEKYYGRIRLVCIFALINLSSIIVRLCTSCVPVHLGIMNFHFIKNKNDEEDEKLICMQRDSNRDLIALRR